MWTTTRPLIAFSTLACPDWDAETVVERATALGYGGVEWRGGPTASANEYVARFVGTSNKLNVGVFDTAATMVEWRGALLPVAMIVRPERIRDSAANDEAPGASWPGTVVERKFLGGCRLIPASATPINLSVD